MSTPLDLLESREPQAREAALMAALPLQIAHAKKAASAFAHRLHQVDAASIASRQALAQLPVLRKHELLERQKQLRASDVFGGFCALGFGPAMPRVFASPGGLYEPEGARVDYWRMGRAMRAAGFQTGELVHNSFSYHFTPAGSMMETAAASIGCTVFPAGVGQTELQLQAMVDLQPQAYVGTPSFLRILLEKAGELGYAIPSLAKALVAGEALPETLRSWFAERGLAVYQSYGTADVGLIAYETPARQGMVLDESVIVEIVRPGTSECVNEGEVGELVVTTLNPDYPLIRFGTGDLTAVLPGPCPTGRTNTRIKGWLGRADQTTKVRGMFVHPSQVAEVLHAFPQVRKARLVVSGEMASDVLHFKVECLEHSAALAEQIAMVFRQVTKLRAEVVLLAQDYLPSDGKVIEDARSYR